MLKYLFEINISFYVAYSKTNTSLCRWSLKFVDRNTQLALTCSKSTKKNNRKRCKICSKLIIKTVVPVFLFLTLNIFHTVFQCFYCYFEQVNVSWGQILIRYIPTSFKVLALLFLLLLTCLYSKSIQIKDLSFQYIRICYFVCYISKPGQFTTPAFQPVKYGVFIGNDAGV